MMTVRRLWKDRPLTLILIAAIFFRIIAVIFSKGYGMFDDHFLVIESSQSWVDGYDYNNWLPSSENTTPKGHSFFYPGIHFGIFWFLEKICITDPQSKMYLIRLLHAALSLIVVIWGFRITERISNLKAARMAGLLLALYWFMPFFSVRNMVEIVSIPFLMYGTWLVVKHQNEVNRKWLFFLAGMLLGLAFNIRFQTIIFSFGIGLVMVIHGKWLKAILLGVGYILTIALVQGLIDIFIWGYPFGELTEYINHNIIHSTDYIVSPWYTYLLLILGILIPPLSFFLLFGFFRSWRKHLIIFLPTLLFLVFHSVFPNKQERFILPVLPFFIMLGVVGWEDFIKNSRFWTNNKQLLKASWIFFWIINLILLPVISTTYSKKAHVESMYYLSRYENKKMILIEHSHKYGVPLLPRYYSDEWPGYIEVDKATRASGIDSVFIKKKDLVPQFVLFIEKDNMDDRLAKMKSMYPDLVYETTVEPGLVDKVMHWLNPVNANNVIIIYRNDAFKKGR